MHVIFFDVHIAFQQFLTQNHSWAIVGQNLARAFLSLSHSVDLVPTDQDKFLPSDLVAYKRENISISSSYDVQISYTAPINFPHYLSHGSKNRFAIWNYETTIVPFYFLKYFSFPDQILPSSQFSKNIFLENKIPEEKMTVIPHGIDYDGLNSACPLKLKTNKNFKIVANIAQIHVRKNLIGLLQAYGQAFTSKDDVCLVLKVSLKEPKLPHELSFQSLFSDFRRKFPKHAEIEIVSEFIPNIGSLYQSCDLVYSLPYTECFWLPGLEGAACGKPSLVSNYGGHLDYLNTQNSYLINGKLIQAPANAQYWSASPKAEMFAPNLDQATDMLRYTYNNQAELKSKESSLRNLAQKYTWESAAKQILSLVK